MQTALAASSYTAVALDMSHRHSLSLIVLIVAKAYARLHLVCALNLQSTLVPCRGPAAGLHSESAAESQLLLQLL